MNIVNWLFNQAVGKVLDAYEWLEDEYDRTVTTMLIFIYAQYVVPILLFAIGYYWAHSIFLCVTGLLMAAVANLATVGRHPFIVLFLSIKDEKTRAAVGDVFKYYTAGSQFWMWFVLFSLAVLYAILQEKFFDHPGFVTIIILGGVVLGFFEAAYKKPGPAMTRIRNLVGKIVIASVLLLVFIPWVDILKGLWTPIAAVPSFVGDSPWLLFLVTACLVTGLIWLVIKVDKVWLYPRHQQPGQSPSVRRASTDDDELAAEIKAVLGTGGNMLRNILWAAGILVGLYVVLYLFAPNRLMHLEYVVRSKWEQLSKRQETAQQQTHTPPTSQQQTYAPPAKTAQRPNVPVPQPKSGGFKQSARFLAKFDYNFFESEAPLVLCFDSPVYVSFDKENWIYMDTNQQIEQGTKLLYFKRINRNDSVTCFWRKE